VASACHLTGDSCSVFMRTAPHEEYEPLLESLSVVHFKNSHPSKYIEHRGSSGNMAIRPPNSTRVYSWSPDSRESDTAASTSQAYQNNIMYHNSYSQPIDAMP